MLAQQLRLHSNFDSAVLQNARDITVYLPPGYRNEQRRFPVLYLQDGQNLFDPRTSFNGTAWHVDETAQALIRTGEIEPLIIIGVNNTGHNRINEYTPTPGRREAGGQAALYGRFLIEELKPFIDSEYDTLPGSEWTGIGGSSLGGLVSLHLGFQRPDVFGRVAALSPSVWWAGGAILREVSALARKPPLKIWLDIGTREGPGIRQQVRALRDLLTSKGWRLREDLWSAEVAQAEHNEYWWGARFGSVLRFLFPAGRRTVGVD